MVKGERINPAVLIWARESAGLEVKEAARKLALAPPDEVAGETRLLEMESGQLFPSRAQLFKIAKTYRRPLLTFYLSAPPPRADRGSDFRTLTSTLSKRDNGALDAVLRGVKARQEMIASILEDEDEVAVKGFVGSCTLEDGVETVAARVSEALGKWALPSTKPISAEHLFKTLRKQTEALGVFVLLLGDLGSHHSALDERVFRGFALADKRVPFIIINDNDAKPARSFTLIHELAHIFLGQTGVSGIPASVKDNSQAGKTEQFCNDVASYVLLPKAFALERPLILAGGTKADSERYIANVAQAWGVSEPMVAFRLQRLGWITSALYQDLSKSYAARWNASKLTAKSKPPNTDEGGPNYYVVRQYRLGDGLLDVVRRTIRDNRLTHTKAAKILDVKPLNVEALIRHFEKTSAPLPLAVPR